MKKQSKKSKKTKYGYQLPGSNSGEIRGTSLAQGYQRQSDPGCREYRTVQQDCTESIQQTTVHQGASGCSGYFYLPLIDGKRTVTDIAALVKEEFGEAAEPLYPRIIKYFQIVESYHFIKFANMPSK